MDQVLERQRLLEQHHGSTRCSSTSRHKITSSARAHQTVWLPDKITRMHNAMIALEAQYGSDSPILIHTDLIMVNEQLRLLAPSVWIFRKLDPVN